MRRFFGKLRFVHARLWRQDGSYRLAALLGPAPLFGGVVAALAWGGFLEFKAMTDRPPPWAPRPPTMPEWATSSSNPASLAPTRALPSLGPDGIPLGYHPGWEVGLSPITVSATLDVDVKRNFVGGFTTGGVGIDMEQILRKAPDRQPLAAVASSFFVVTEPGVYAFSIRFDRPPDAAATCVIRLGVGTERVNSNVEVNVVNKVAKSYAVGWFNLQPGLYPVGWVFGCWSEGQSAGPGAVTVLVRRPGQPLLLPATDTDFVR